jgi:hypothetical protein
MFYLRFSHGQNKLWVGEKEYRATCTVRNELNGWRKPDEVVNSMPIHDTAMPYQPRPFPTGVWRVRYPEYTFDPEFAPVKIPTSAKRRVFLWDIEKGEYVAPNGETQEDNYYHLHYAGNSKTTLGCIRLDSAEDAVEIAKTLETELSKGPVWIEVVL